MKRILCIIESLGPGGAERQMAGLAAMLKQQGYQVEVWYYVKKEFYLPYLHDNEVCSRYLSDATKRGNRFHSLWKHVNSYRPDTIISYSSSASMICCVMKMFGSKFNLIVSERNTTQKSSWISRVRFFLYRWADYVVPNSFSQKNFINSHSPKLAQKVRTIINFVDTQAFVPKEHLPGRNIVIAATVWPSKNALGFLEALKILKDKGLKFHVKWFGVVPDQMEYYNKCIELVRELGLKDYIEFLEKSKNIADEYQAADIFCLPSFFEGTPNALCEAMSCGLPILCSAVCDNPRYVVEGENGFLFNPLDFVDISNAIEKALAASDEELLRMGQLSRQKALAMFDKETFVEKYINLIEA